MNQETGTPYDFLNPNRANKKKTLNPIIRSIILAVAISISLLVCKTPYMFQAPGKSDDVSLHVKVMGVPYQQKSQGKFFLTTVIYGRANLLLYIWGKLDKSTELTEYKKNIESDLLERQNSYMREQMEISKVKAKIAAFRTLGYNVKIERGPVEIAMVLPASKSKDLLRPKDIILDIDGEPIKTESDLIAKIENYKDGGAPKLTIRRGERQFQLNVPLIQAEGKKKIGILVVSRIIKADIPKEVNFQTNNIIGASAGMMFALEIMKQATGIDLTGGNRIAGTGVVDETGKVLSVEGVRFKVAAAEREKAQYFFVPKKNYAEALKAATKVKVYPVETLEDAVRVLKQINPNASIDEHKKKVEKQQM
jgi:PDZ domain-containing protein